MNLEALSLVEAAALIRQGELSPVDYADALLRRIDEVHRSYRRELVPWQPPGAALRRSDHDAAG